MFPSLITSICLVSEVKISANDESIKNEGDLTTRTVERIAGEIADATTPEHVAVSKARNVWH